VSHDGSSINEGDRLRADAVHGRIVSTPLWQSKRVDANFHKILGGPLVAGFSYWVVAPK
jgi:hypothetical protein